MTTPVDLLIMRRSQGTSRLNHITLHVEVSFLNVNYMISIQCLHASPHAICFFFNVLLLTFHIFEGVIQR